jgi:hypothetical protein
VLLAVLLGFAVSARTDRRFGVDEGGSSGSRHLSKDLEHGGRYTEIDPPTRAVVHLDLGRRHEERTLEAARQPGQYSNLG